jgi:predicted DNA-binding protein with PD1-like motif
MARPGYIQQVGPEVLARVSAVEGRGRAFSMTLKAGLSLVEAVRAGFAEAGFASGVLNFGQMALGPFAYVMPALSKDGKNAAFYSDAFRPEGVTRTEEGALTFGQRDGAPFFHCHALWREANGKRSGGHMLPEETFLAEDAVVSAFGITSAGFEGNLDPEINFKVFGPVSAATSQAKTERRAFAMRLHPNRCFHTLLEDFAREKRLKSAIIHGGVGSTIGALLEDGQEIENFATEVYISRGTIELDAAGNPVATLDVGLIDYTGAMARGRLKRGANPVLMTFELIVADT